MAETGTAAGQGAIPLDTVKAAIMQRINEHGGDPEELLIEEKAPGVYVVTAQFPGDLPDEHGTFTAEGLRLT
jgi:hypothetical protein